MPGIGDISQTELNQILHNVTAPENIPEGSVELLSEPYNPTIPDVSTYTPPPVQANIPQWLQDMAKSGYGTEFMRSSYTKAGEKVSSQALAQERMATNTGASQGFSAVGYVQPVIAGLEKRKKRALIDMEYAIKNQNEAAKRKALATINAIKYQQSQINNMLANQDKREELANMLRNYQEEYTRRQLEANKPLPWYEQLAGAGLSWLTFGAGSKLGSLFGAGG